MANKDREITIKVKLDGNNAVKGSAKVKQSVRGIKDETGKASKGMKGFGLQTVATGAVAAIALNKIKDVTIAAVNESYRLATAAQETASKYHTVLGPSVGEANKFLDANATKMGLNETKAQDLLATTTAIAQGFGFAGGKAADMGMDVVKLAGDLTSFNNVPIERTHNAITSALSGETEALKSLGIVIRQQEVNERALANTGIDSADALTQQQKAAATLQLITEKAGVAVGDLNRTQNSTANRARKAKAELENLEIELSKRLMPAFSGAVDLGGDLIGVLNDWVKVPLSEELKNEQIQLNALVSQITDTNIKQQRRNELIGDLQSTYPNFLKNLDTENVTNKQLADRLEQVNQNYTKKIALQAQAEATQDAQNNLQDALADKFEREIDLRREIMRINDEYHLGLDTTNKSIEELTANTKEALQATMGTATTGKTDAFNKIGRSMAGLHESQQDVNNAQQSLDQQMQIAQGLADKYNVSLGKLLGTQQDWADSLDTASNQQLQSWKTALKAQMSAVDEASDDYKNWAAMVGKINDALDNLSGSGNGDNGGLKGINKEIKDQQKKLDKLLNKKSAWTDAEKQQAIATNDRIQKLKDLKKAREEIINGGPVVPNKKPQEPTPIKAQGIDTSGGFEAADPIITQLNRRMQKEQEYFALQQRLQIQRQLLAEAQTQSEKQKAQATIIAIEQQIATRKMLSNTVLQAAATDIKSLDEYAKYIEQTVKKAIKARIAQAVATQMEKALARVPFPFNVAAAAAAGGAVSLLINKFVPDFGRGGLLEGPSHARGGIPVMHRGQQVAEAEGNEAIINTRSTKMFYDELSAINKAGGGRRFPGAKTVVSGPSSFAGGGVMKANLGNSYADQALGSQGLVESLRKALESANLTAPVDLRHFSEEQNNEKEIEGAIGNNV